LESSDIRKATVVEILITYISLGWSFVMLTNDDIFDKSENFNKLQSLVQTEWVVGVVCLFLAIVKIYGMVLKNNKIRWLGLILSTFFWIIVSSTFLLSAGKFMINTGFVVYSGLAVMCLWTSKEVNKIDRAE